MYIRTSSGVICMKRPATETQQIATAVASYGKINATLCSFAIFFNAALVVGEKGQSLS